MDILIVNQSIIDMCASFFTLLTAVVEVNGTRMSLLIVNQSIIDMCASFFTLLTAVVEVDGHSDREPEHHRHVCVFLHAVDGCC